jgi:hypothetical protein
MSRLTVVQTLLPSSPRTATAPNVSTGINCGEFIEGSLHITVTSASGTVPRLRPIWQQSHDGLAWADHSAMATFSNATGVKVLPLATIGQYGRVKCTIGGTAAVISYGAYFTGKW